MANLSEIRDRADVAENISLKLVDEETDSEISIKVKKSDQIGTIRLKLAIPWCNKRFLYNGRVVHDRETPLACEMEDDDVIICSLTLEKETRKIIAESRMKSPVEDQMGSLRNCSKKLFDKKKIKEEVEDRQTLYKLLVEERKKNADLTKENEELFSWKYETLTEKQEEMQKEIEHISEQCDQEKNAQVALYQELKREQLECEKLRRENVKYAKIIEEHEVKIAKHEQEILTQENMRVQDQVEYIEHEKLKSDNFLLEKKVKELKCSEENLNKQNKILKGKLSMGHSAYEGSKATGKELDLVQAELDKKSSDMEMKDAEINVLQWELSHMKDAHDRLYKECRQMVADNKKGEKQDTSLSAKNIEEIEDNLQTKIKVEPEETDKEEGLHPEYVEAHYKSIKRECEFYSEESDVVKRQKLSTQPNQEFSEHQKNIDMSPSILNIEDSPQKE